MFSASSASSRPVSRAALVLTFGLATTGAAQTPTSPAALTPGQSAPKPVWTWGAEVDSSSRYVWHGLPYSEGMVVWPSAWLSAYGFTLGLWLNADHQYEPAFNEYDLSIGYERAIGRATIGGTLSRYTYRELSGDPGSTSEAIVRAAFAIGPGAIVTTSSFDIEKYVGAYYVDFGYAVERQFTARSLLQVDGSVALWTKFAEEYGVPSDGPLGPAVLNVALVHTLTDAIAVRPHVTFTRLLDRVARQAVRPPGVTYGAAVVIGSR